MSAAYRQTAEWLRQRLPEVPKVAMILGTGLNGIAERKNPGSDSIPKYPEQHRPFARKPDPRRTRGQKVLYLQAVSSYEGHPFHSGLPTRVLACQGTET